jgi:hypothetical protein
MRSILRRSVIVAGAILVFAGGVTNASASSIMEVKVPFPFVVNRQIFPAGEYRIERGDTSTSILLIRGEHAKHAGMFAMTIPASGQDPAGWKPALTFTRSENQYRLTDVWESGTQGVTIIGR